MTETPNFVFAPFKDYVSKEFAPSQAHATDTGYDVRVCGNETEQPEIFTAVVCAPKQVTLVPLGIKAICPDGWWLQLNPRSSTFFKKKLITLIGVIDNGYENEIKLAVYNPSEEAVVLDHAERVGQLIPYKLEKMTVHWITSAEFEEKSAERKDARGLGGFGSTGKQ